MDARGSEGGSAGGGAGSAAAGETGWNASNAASTAAEAGVVAPPAISVRGGATAFADDGAAGVAGEAGEAGAGEAAAATAGTAATGENIVVKVALLGDSGVGKTSLMVRYVERIFSSDYVETLGVNFMEKAIVMPQSTVTMSIWDLGGERSFASMLPMVVVDAVAILFCFDLNDKKSLSGIREWYRQARGLNKNALAFLVGTKYDLFIAERTKEEQEEVTALARRFAKAMHASALCYCSSALGINVLRLFKLIFEKAFGLEVDVEQISEAGHPLLEIADEAQ